VKQRDYRVFVLVVLVLSFPLISVTAQELAIDPGQYKLCLFSTVDLSASNEYREYREIVTKDLRTELRKAGFNLVPREEWDIIRDRRGVAPDELYQGMVAISIAREAEADLTVVSSFSVEDGLMALDIKCYDVPQEALITGVFKTVRVNLSIYNALSEAAAELIPKIRLLGPPPEVPADVVEEIALLSDDEDMEIYLGDEGLVGTISDGKLLLPPIPFAVGTKVDIEKRKDGYHTGQQTVKLKDQKMVIKLSPLRKKTQMATELNWTLGQLLGFGLAQRLYLKPDSTYLCAEHYFYIQHNFSGGKPVYHHDLRALFGAYLLTGPDRLLRVNVSAGFGLIFTYFSIDNQPSYTDYYWDIINMGLELNLQKYILYIRSEVKYALGLGPTNFLGRKWISIFNDGGPTVLTLGIARKW